MDVGAAELSIMGGTDLVVHRSDISAIRLSTGFLTTRVTVIWLDDTESALGFETTRTRERVRVELQHLGWPIVDEHTVRRYRPSRRDVGTEPPL